MEPASFIAVMFALFAIVSLLGAFIWLLVMGIFLLFHLLFVGMVLGLLGFWIWMIVDCAQNEPSTGNDKIAWLLLLIFTNWIGALIYYFIRMAPRQKLTAQIPPAPRS